MGRNEFWCPLGAKKGTEKALAIGAAATHNSAAAGKSRIFVVFLLVNTVFVSYQTISLLLLLFMFLNLSVCWCLLSSEVEKRRKKPSKIFVFDGTITATDWLSMP